MKCRIKITDGKASKGNKEVFAIAIEDYLLEIIDNEKVFEFDGSLDINSKRLKWHLKKMFPEYEWILNSSQNPYDIVSVSGGVAIELKAERGLSKPTKKGFYTNHTNILSNATIYPDMLKASDVLNKNSLFNKLDPESILDVLVVVVARDSKNKKAVDYRIVDGSYWGITYDMYKGCKELFTLTNENISTILEVIHRLDKNNAFVNDLLSGNDFLKFNFRKLISLKNPLRDSFDYSEPKEKHFYV